MLLILGRIMIRNQQVSGSIPLVGFYFSITCEDILGKATTPEWVEVRPEFIQLVHCPTVCAPN